MSVCTQQNYVVEFKWRPETVVEYMSSPGSSTSSGLARVAYDYYDPDDADGDIVDTLKFRLVLKPDNAGTLMWLIEQSNYPPLHPLTVEHRIHCH
jgi:hypothetical protein